MRRPPAPDQEDDMPLSRAVVVAAVVAVALGPPAPLTSFVPAVSAQSSAIDVGSLSALGNSFLWAVNDRNEAVGWSELQGLDSEHAIVWRDAQLVDLGVLDGFDASRALGINDRGQIVGLSVEFGLFHTRAMLWQDGQMIELMPGFDGCSARAINNRGEIALWCGGSIVLRKGESIGIGLPPGFTSSFPAAINDAGAVAGSLSDGSARSRGFVWEDGTTTVLEPPPGLDTAVANAIDRHGNVVGYVGQASVIDSLEPAVWHDGKVAPLAGRWGAFHGVAQGINDHGDVVGAGHDAAHVPDQPGGAFVWSRSRFTFLPPGATANDINNHGVAVGYFFFDPGGILHGMVWPKAAMRSPHGGRK